MASKTREYESKGIVVEYEAAKCIHAKECVHRLPKVFDAEARPWIQPDNASADAIMEVVRACPTGALHYRRTDGGAEEEPATENTLRVVPDGPVYLSGRLRLEFPDGESRDETRVALCRCGDSKNKPFCDNSHIETGFSDAGTVVDRPLPEAAPDAGEALHIKLAKNGPVLLTGPVTVIGSDESSATGGRAAICRCGASSSKPYCDGTHKESGFEAD